MDVAAELRKIISNWKWLPSLLFGHLWFSCILFYAGGWKIFLKKSLVKSRKTSQLLHMSLFRVEKTEAPEKKKKKIPPSRSVENPARTTGPRALPWPHQSERGAVGECFRYNSFKKKSELRNFSRNLLRQQRRGGKGEPRLDSILRRDWRKTVWFGSRQMASEPSAAVGGWPLCGARRGGSVR